MSFKDIFSYKGMLNKNTAAHELSDADIKRLQNCMTTCTKELLDVCNKYNIKLILQGGTLLGYVRHNGFIPWDDDMDFGLLREDYNRFIEIFDRELSDRYYISAPRKRYPTYNRFVQVFRKGTIFDDGQIENNERPLCIGIDLFPLDYAPNNKLIRWLKGIRANIIMAVGGSVDTYKHMNPKLKAAMLASASGRIQYIIRMIIGFLFSWRDPKKWFEVIDVAVTGHGKTGYITSGTGRWHYLNEIIPSDTVLPLQKVNFEGLELYAPNNPDYYLTHNYGNYMSIPPLEKREKHFAVRIKTLQDVEDENGKKKME